MLGLKPIKLLPARERVASAIREAIIQKKIKEGEILTLDTTAQELARDGLIELKQNKGAIVLGFNETTIREHYQIRAAMESEACELCCENKADLSAIKNCVDAATEALEHDDYSSFINYNQSFHYEIWRAAGNEKMEHMLAELWNGLSLGVQSTVEKYAKRSNEEHRAIYEAMEKRDAEASRKEMRYHIYRSMEDMLTRYE